MKTKNYIEQVGSGNSEFCIIGLTGKVRAGTSDVCKLLVDPQFPDRVTQPADTSNYDMSEIREHKIIYRYLHHNWHPFLELSVSDIILSFILDTDNAKLQEEVVDKENGEKVSMYDLIEDARKTVCFESIIEKVTTVTNALRFPEHENPQTVTSNIQAGCNQICSVCTSVDKILDHWKGVHSNVYKKETSLSDLFFCFGYLTALRLRIQSILGKDNYTICFQKYGNNIRASGKAINDSDLISVDKLFFMPERINKFIKMLRYSDIKSLEQTDIFKSDSAFKSSGSQKSKNSIFIVINNFKNIFETLYFKKRYSAFYLIAVSCDEKMRINRFGDINKFRLAELRENLSSGKNVYSKIQDRSSQKYDPENFDDEFGRKFGLNRAELLFLKEVYGAELQETAYKNNCANFILQDVVTCVENADIFISRNYGEVDYRCDYSLIRQLGRIITLILHPGLLTPTKVERCMQIAMTAKLNSGCLSRQVGAVVTDAEYSILSIGWNDSPCGDESCIRRNMYDLLRKHDPYAYSEYELYNEEFRAYLSVIEGELNSRKSELKGLPLAFCFKDIHQSMIKQRDQIYTRALHGEERALVSCDSERAKGGCLFTTSSPCELCAKKAKDAKIKKIYYIEQYPGISRSHIINFGHRSRWASYELFVGAVGSAYVKLYTPILPYKDELAILEFSPKNIYGKMTQKNSGSEPSSGDAIPSGSSNRDNGQTVQDKQDD